MPVLWMLDSRKFVMSVSWERYTLSSNQRESLGWVHVAGSVQDQRLLNDGPLFISTTTFGPLDVVVTPDEETTVVHMLDVTVEQGEVWDVGHCDAGNICDVDSAVDCVNVVAVVVLRWQPDVVTTASEADDVTTSSTFVLLLLTLCASGSRNSFGKGRFFRGRGQEILDAVDP